MATVSEAEVFSTRALAERYGTTNHIIRAALDAAGLGHRVGQYRIVTRAELPLVELALRARNRLETPGRPAGAAG